MLEPAQALVTRRKAWAAVLRYAPRHKGFLWRGLGLTLLVVAAQLSLPWPLKELLGGSAKAGWRAGLPAGVSPFLAMGSLFFVLMTAAGYFDFVQRVAFARFAIGWSRDLRSAASVAARNPALGAEELHAGDLVARLIGDVARFKASLKVTLVYVATNALLFLFGCGVIWWIHAPFGMIFTASFVLALVVAGLGARRSYRDFAGYRHVEGQLATSLSGSGEMVADDLLDSARLEASEVRQQSGVAWLAHGIVGAMVCAILLLGARGLERGTLDPGVLILFLGYALFLSKPLVRLTRHGARMGKLVASGLRLGSYLAAAAPAASDLVAAPAHSIEIKDQGRSVWLPASGIVGTLSSTSTPWLAALIGSSASAASVLFDGSVVPPPACAARTEVVTGRPTWTCASLQGLVDTLAGTALEESLAGFGLIELARARAGRAVASNETSRSEATAVALALAAAKAPTVFVLDLVRESLDEEGEVALVRWISSAAREALVVVRSADLDWLPAGALRLDSEGSASPEIAITSERGC